MSCINDERELCGVDVNQCPRTRPEAQQNWWILEEIRKKYCEVGVLDCDAVRACLGLITEGENITVTGDYTTGFVISSIDTNTQLTCEQVRACLGAIAEGENITVTGDYENGYTISSVNTNTQLTCEEVRACLGDLIEGTNITITGDYETGFIINSTDTNTQLTCEEVAACFGGIIEGANITVTGDYATGFTISSTDTNTQLTCEQVKDCLTDTVTIDEDGNVTIVQNDDTTVTFSTKSCCPAPPIVENWDGTKTTLTIPVPPEDCEVNKDSIQFIANGAVQAPGFTDAGDYGFDCALNVDGTVTVTSTENWGEPNDTCRIIVYYSLNCSL